METQQSKLELMTETPVKRLICRLALPTMASMIVTALYNMADTYFVGGISNGATGGVGICFSAMAIVQAVGFTFGMGSGNYISRLLGRGERERAEHVAATGFFSSFAVGCIIAALMYIFIDPLIIFLGATDTIFPYAKDYLRIILIGVPFMTSSFTMNNILRFQGSAFYGMLGIMTGGVLNIALDPLFISVCDMGTAGAALATIISQAVSFTILFTNCFRGSNIRIRFKNFSFTWEMYYEIFRGGLPSFYRQGMASLAVLLLNNTARPYGDPAIAAMSVVSKVTGFAFSLLIGFGQGYQPVCGFNYGAKKYGRVLEGFWFVVKVGIGIFAVASVAGYIFAPEIIALFRDDPKVIEIGSRALRAQCIALPFAAWMMSCNMMLQTIGDSFKASLLALARSGLFFLPTILILPRLYGLTGIEIAQPVADICSFILALALASGTLVRLKTLHKNSIANPEH